MDISNEKNCSMPLTMTRVATSANRGFTLIELLLTMAIIGILAGLSMTMLTTAKDKARTARAMSEIRLLEKEIAAYAAEKAANPLNLGEIGRAAAGTNICTLLDPWGNPYIYNATPVRTATGPFINTDYDLYSWGPSLTSTGLSIIDDPDDIIRANDGSFTGVALKYGI